MAAGGHFVKIQSNKKVVYRSEMARNAIESDFRTSKMGAGGHFVKNLKKLLRSVYMHLKWPEMPSKVNFGNPKWPIDLKWPEMRLKVNFEYPKCPPAAIL